MARAICTRCASPGELRGVNVLALGQHELLQQFQRAGFGLPVREAEVAAVVVEVLVDCQRAVQGVELRHHADQPPRMGRMPDHVDARDRDPAAGGQRARGGNRDGGRLAGSVRPQQPEDLALLQLQVDAVHGHHAQLRFVDFGQIFNFDNQGVHPAREGKYVQHSDYRTGAAS
jgi:hypothetical protein